MIGGNIKALMQVKVPGSKNSIGERVVDSTLSLILGLRL